MADIDPAVNCALTAALDPQAQGAPAYEFDQRLAW
jgi:hypothetical protein